MPLKEKKIYPKWKAAAHGGRLCFEDEGAFSKFLISLDDRELHVIVKRRSKSRSRQEEKFYHAVVVRMVAEAMSVEDQEAHELLKSLFLKREERSVSGKFRYERVMSTTELDDGAYREYWEKCMRWAALPTNPSGLSEESGLELYIPEPNEIEYEDY